jgi:hypothetical protein
VNTAQSVQCILEYQIEKLEEFSPQSGNPWNFCLQTNYKLGIVFRNRINYNPAPLVYTKQLLYNRNINQSLNYATIVRFSKQYEKNR